MAAALRRERNLHGALGAVFGSWHGSGLRRKTINLLDQEKDAKCDDEEIDDSIQKNPIIQSGRVRCFRYGQRVVTLAVQADEQAREINFCQAVAPTAA